MTWRELQRFVARVVIAVTLYLFFPVGVARAGTIIKLDANNLSPTTQPPWRNDLLGISAKVAVGGGHVYVMTYRGWIYSLDSNSNTLAYQVPPGAPPGEKGVKMLGADTSVTSNNGVDFEAVALAVSPLSTGDVYGGRVNGWVWHYNSSLAIQNQGQQSSQPLVPCTLVDLTVDDDTGKIYAACANGKIYMSSPGTNLSFVYKKQVNAGTGTVKMIKAQKRTTSSGVVVDLYVTLSGGSLDGLVYRIDTSSSSWASVSGFVGAYVGTNSSGDVIGASSTTLYKINPADITTSPNFLSVASNLIGVDVDNTTQKNVVTVDGPTGVVYRTDPTLTSATFPPASSSLVLKVTQTKSIALDAGSIYVIGGSQGASEGDPHLKTIDGLRYDFQSAGEFVLLRHAGNLKGEASGTNVGASYSHDAAEIQVRQFPVATTANTCVSLNSAVAAQVGKHTVTYEPNLSGEPDPSGLQLRIDHRLTALDPSGIRFGDGGRVVPTSASGGLEIDFPDDTILFVTPGWWPSQGKWYLNVNVIPQHRAGGLVGDVPEGSWLPALPDGTSMGPAPTSPHEHYVALYERFADAWRVTDKTSLFDYAPGTSTKTFTMPGWPPESGSCSIPGTVPVEGTTEKVAREVCKVVPGDPANCIFDVKVTGLINIANTYAASRNAQPVPEKKTQPEPRCASWRTIALLVVLGVLVLLALWVLLRRALR